MAAQSPPNASVSDRDLTAIQEGREILHSGSLADLILLADTLGIRPLDLRVRGVVDITTPVCGCLRGECNGRALVAPAICRCDHARALRDAVGR